MFDMTGIWWSLICVTPVAFYMVGATIIRLRKEEGVNPFKEQRLGMISLVVAVLAIYAAVQLWVNAVARLFLH